ncbi:hypothetical protein OC834_001470 [Tilletia horrida]|nr:hypothetical protein OC834_001470 [Tilletia horrida]
MGDASGRRTRGKRRVVNLVQAAGLAALALGAVQRTQHGAHAAAVDRWTERSDHGGRGSGSRSGSARLVVASSSKLVLRHGDHGHDGEDKAEEEHQHEHEHEHPHDEHAHMHHHENSASGSIPYANFTHEHGPWTEAQNLPDPWTAGPLLMPIPPPPPGQWGGHHHHGDAPALTEFNETALFYSKSAAPLSYIEWDMNWGPARINELRRFVAAGEAETDGVALMGAVDGRWRKLFDEWDPVKRVALNKQMKSFVEHQDPTRHVGLMAAHVAGCIIACFILLPITLAFRAANSSLAPLSALAYLVTLFFSLCLGGLYKALSPPLFAPNSHGKMGWALFWISSVVFAFDIVRLVRQIASIFVGPRAVNSGGGRWRSLWSRMSGASTSGVNGIALNEYYSPAEEERMLQTTHSEEDAEEVVTLAKNIEDNDGHAAYHHHSVGYQPRPVQRNGSHSSSASSSRTAEDGACPSPSGTLVGTPRGSLAHATFTSLPWLKNHISRSASPSSSQDETMGPDAEKNADGAGGRVGRGPVRQHRRGLSSISTLWEREASPERDAALSLSPTTPARPDSATLSPKTRRQTTFGKIVRYTHVTVARALPILAFAASYTGLTVYTGACRAGTINGCAAHGIKGGIFFWFGLLTFGRYIGAYADHGWAWNARPKSSKVPSAEFVESLVIFTYGATNTWMERFGAKPGEPYSVKQVQHISIAVMYWFAGLVGMMIETKWTKRLLGVPIALTHPSARPHPADRRGELRDEDEVELDAEEYARELMDAQRQPPSYAGSFNPFPALCIGVTGVAMAAHHQDYVYEVEVHALWGNLLAAFAVLRCLTYFFLYLRPPSTSILPGRPPTEALASFALACGGLVFMLSSEEVSFLAMRTGWSDIMMITNVTVAAVCLVFCGIAGMFILKAWAVKRELGRDRARGRAVPTSGRGAISLRNGASDEARRGLHARVAARAATATAASAAVPVFVVGEDGEEEDVAPHAAPTSSGGVLTSSPDSLPVEMRTLPAHARI